MNTVLFYINTIKIGGAERVLVQLTKHFSKAGWNVLLVTSFPVENEYPVLEQVKRIQLEQEEIEQTRIMRNVSRIQKLRKICKREKPDVVVSFMQEPNFRAVLATIGLPTKCIVSVRNDPAREYPGIVGKIAGKLILPLANGCVFQTEDAKKWFPSRMQNKSAIIQNEVDEVFFSTERKPAGNVVALGRLSEQKNHRMLIRAFAKIAEKHPNENLLIYGVGDQKAALQEEIAAQQMTNRVFLMGLTEEAPDVLAGAKIFALSSDYEGMPNCLLEAVAVGVPSISTDCPCGGPKSIIEHGKNGLLVPVGDETAMANALDKLLSDPEYAKKIGSAAKESAKRFKPDTVFLQWEAVVKKVISGK